MFAAAAEAIVEHRAYSVAQPDGSTRIDEINTWVGVRIKKRVMKGAVNWRVNITARHVRDYYDTQCTVC